MSLEYIKKKNRGLDEKNSHLAYMQKIKTYEKKLDSIMLTIDKLSDGTLHYQNSFIMLAGLNILLDRVQSAIDGDKKSQEILDGKFNYLELEV